MKSKYLFTCLSILISGFAFAQQDTVRYIGSTLSNVDYHHGQLPLAMGTHNMQVLRAGRDTATAKHGFGWTYNHAPDLAYWNNQFFLEYLADPVGEHIPPGQTLLLSSKDGYQWSEPVVIFPPYKVPDGFTKPGNPVVAKNLFAVMHQRMGFYVSGNKKLLALAYYGIALDEKDDPNDGNGIGRVVREVKQDGSFGPIYFIRYNHNFNEKNSDYPFYKKSKDKAFIAACDELLSKPLMMQRWNEEADRDDPLVPLKKEFKAFNFYHLPDKRVVGLWKHALTSITEDEGRTWKYNPTRAPKFVNSNAKIWGQRTSDGKYATVYNPSEYRWPLALSVSDDGLNYKNLLLVSGELPPMRYGGNYKSYGPQYVHGILEGNGAPPDGKLWVSYSVNKEDLWVAAVPVPVRTEATQKVNDQFNQSVENNELVDWNIHSGTWTPVRIETRSNERVLTFRDSDPYQYATATRLIPKTNDAKVTFSIIPEQVDHGTLHVEIQDAKGNPGVRIVFDADSLIKIKAGSRFRSLGKYEAGTRYDIRLDVSTAARMCKVSINGKPENGTNTILYAPMEVLERVHFRTGAARHFPTPDTPADNKVDLPNAGVQEKEAVFHLLGLRVD